MTYYDWDRIISGLSDKELQNTLKQKGRIPIGKVEAAAKELKNRNLIDEKYLVLESNTSKTVEDFDYEKEKLLIKPNHKNSKIAILMLLVICIIQILSVFLEIKQLNLLDELGYANSGNSQEIFSRNGIIIIWLLVFSIISYGLSAFTFIKWFHRAYYNLHKRTPGCKYESGWAIGSWFIPIVNLFRPSEIMMEMWVKSKELISDHEITKKYRNLTVSAWWGIWVAGIILQGFSVNISNVFESRNGLMLLLFVSIVSGIIWVISALLGIKVVYDYNRMEAILSLKEK